MRRGNQGICRQKVIRVAQLIRTIEYKRCKKGEHNKENKGILKGVVRVKSNLIRGNRQGKRIARPSSMKYYKVQTNDTKNNER